MALHKPHGRFAVPGHGRSAPRQQWDAYFKRRQLRGVGACVSFAPNCRHTQQ